MEKFLTHYTNNHLQANNLDISNYIININKFPILNLLDEKKITKYFKKTLDIKAANILILTHLRFVAKVAKYYIKYGLFINDLIQEGSIGLIKSIRKYRHDKKIRLVTFSIHWIKSEIHSYILRNWKIVKTFTTRQQKMLFFSIKKKENNIFLSNERNNIFKKSNIKILNIDNFNEKKESDENVIKKNNVSFILNKNLKKNTNKHLKKILISLDKRSKEIIYKRYLSRSYTNYTLSNLSIIFKISKERVRQIEKTAILRIKKEIKL